MVLGMAQMRLGRLDEARAHLRQAVALAEQIPDYYSGVLTSGELVQFCRARANFRRPSRPLRLGYSSAPDSRWEEIAIPTSYTVKRSVISCRRSEQPDPSERNG